MDMNNNETLMTHYEYTRIRGIRLQQLEDGCQPFVEISDCNSNIEIFNKEVNEKKLPFIIERKINASKSEYLKASEMKIDSKKM